MIVTVQNSTVMEYFEPPVTDYSDAVRGSEVKVEARAQHGFHAEEAESSATAESNKATSCLKLFFFLSLSIIQPCVLCNFNT